MYHVKEEPALACVLLHVCVGEEGAGMREREKEREVNPHHVCLCGRLKVHERENVQMTNLIIYGKIYMAFHGPQFHLQTTKNIPSPKIITSPS